MTTGRPHKFRDPIHGFIYVSDYEKRIIDSAPFQRLRNIKQLALTHYVFHGAEHTRFGHSLGVMHIATKAFRSAVSKPHQFFDYDDTYKATIPWLEQILRIIALTHDIGHAPFSHAAETLFPVKPESKNLTRIEHFEHEDYTEFIIQRPEIADVIREIGKDFVKKHGEDFDITPEMICNIYRGRDPGKNSLFTFIKTFMDSELDCDKMDYLLRDSLYCGVSYGKYDLERLLSSLTIFTKENDDDVPFLGIESGGIQAFEEFVLARYFMFVQVYFHRTRRFFDLKLVEAMKEILPDGTFSADMDEYLRWDDVLVMQKLREYAAQAGEETAAKLIVNRTPWTCIYTSKTHPTVEGSDLFEFVRDRLEESFGEGRFAKSFLSDTSADKLPHKVVPRKHFVDEEETIAIFDKRTHKISTISDESYIINNLTEKIDIRRLYADEACRDKAMNVVQRKQKRGERCR